MTGTSFRKISRSAAVCFALVLSLWCMAGTFLFASAEETTGSLTLWCVKDNDIVSGMNWHLYRVGARTDSDYEFGGDFADCRTTLGDRMQPIDKWDAETVEAVGETLKIESIVRKIPALADGTTDDRGCVTFSGLENGLYLAWGEILRVGNTTYIPSALFFEMTGEDTALLNAYPKIVMKTRSDSDQRYSVRKVWENDADEPWNRSVSITMERYCNHQYYDEVTLSEENDWTFSWSDADSNEWFVYEKIIPEHYTVMYRQKNTQYLIVNTYTGGGNVTTTTAVTTTDTGSSTGTTTVTAVTTVPQDKIVQTGQLWWPVPALAGGGILLLGIGAALRKKEDEE